MKCKHTRLEFMIMKTDIKYTLREEIFAEVIFARRNFCEFDLNSRKFTFIFKIFWNQNLFFFMKGN